MKTHTHHTHTVPGPLLPMEFWSPPSKCVALKTEKGPLSIEELCSQGFNPLSLVCNLYVLNPGMI